MSPEPQFAQELTRLVETDGPISVAEYMARANAHYYGSRDPLGPRGDFTTAPEISQMFGELIGLWLADLWVRAGRPADVRYVELGPGRGTLAADALRAMRSVGLEPPVHFVETSPVLRQAQASRVQQASWHHDLASLAEGAPLLVVANEFFDALPARQIIATQGGWRERLVVAAGEGFRPVAGPAIGSGAIPKHLRNAPPGTVIETSPASIGIVRQLAQLLASSGGAALIVDYGHERTSAGETLQAVAKHGFTDPWLAPGDCDLTVHVDFEALGIAAGEAGLNVYGPRVQGDWLKAMGIEARAASLSRSSPDRREEIEAAGDRLTSPEQMGQLFKAMALVSGHRPEPAAF